MMAEAEISADIRFVHNSAPPASTFTSTSAKLSALDWL
jgi:hypothetical protein